MPTIKHSDALIVFFPILYLFVVIEASHNPLYQKTLLFICKISSLFLCEVYLIKYIIKEFLETRSYWGIRRF